MLAMARSTRDLEMRMSERQKPKGIASGNATNTTASAMRKPWNTMGRLVKINTGFRKRRRKRLEFHACTPGLLSSACSI